MNSFLSRQTKSTPKSEYGSRSEGHPYLDSLTVSEKYEGCLGYRHTPKVEIFRLWEDYGWFENSPTIERTRFYRGSQG
jgi:hypothetical protein